MNNFVTLYSYELKKICKRKIVWITMGMLMALAVFMGVGELFSTYTSSTYTTDSKQDSVVKSGYEFLMENKANAEALNGQRIDDAMLEEVKDAYQRMYTTEHESEDGRMAWANVTGTFVDEDIESMEECARKREQYEVIYRYVVNVTGDYNAIHTINEEGLYQGRLEKIQSIWAELKLTEKEKAYWLEQENVIDKPFVYGYAGGWNRILETFLSLTFMLVLAIAICLSNVFSDEHLRKTDQLILCSRYGKKTLFFSKMTAGVTFGVGSAVILLFLTVISNLCVYGAEGAKVAVQVYLPACSWNVTMGKAVFIVSVVYMAASVFCSVIAMFLSEAMKNSVAVMGVMTGSLIFTMLVTLPYRFRVISQLYELLPSVLLNVWHMWDDRLVNIFGEHFTNFQIAPILYMAVSIVLIFWGNRIYRKYQVSGR